MEEEDIGGRNLLSRFVLQTGTKGPSLVPVCNTNRDKRFSRGPTSGAVGRRPLVPVRGYEPGLKGPKRTGTNASRSPCGVRAARTGTNAP